MQRFKILGAICTFMLLLFAFALNFNEPIAFSESHNTLSIDRQELTIVEKKEARLYKLQQQELENAIEAYFDKAYKSGKIVGAGVSIVRGDSIVFSDGFGKRSYYTNESVDGQTVFRLGSLSKGFAGIMAAKLIHEGKLKWDDKVSEYIPEFQLGDRSNTNKITLANILSHTSGAPYHSYTNLIEAGLPLTDIAKYFKDLTPISSPGALYSYQNALFALSSEMMQKATGQEITQALENTFFKPLEMSSTTMDYKSLVVSENVAIPHSKRRSGWRPKKPKNNYYNAVVAGGINASADDMAKWMRFLLGHNPEIMDKLAIETAFDPYIEIKGRSKYYQRWPGLLSSHYGFGWRIHKFIEGNKNVEKTIWHHGGSVNNYRNEIAVYPEANLGICVLLNNNSQLAKTVIPDLYKIVNEVYDKTSTQIVFQNTSNTIPPL